MKRVFVSGMGIISALGNGASANLNKLLLGSSGIGKANHFNSKYSDQYLFGEVNYSNSELLEIAKLEGQKGRNRTELLAHIAIKEALNDANLDKHQIGLQTSGLISATTVEGMCNTNEMHSDMNNIGHASDFINSYDFGAHTLKLAQDFNFTSYTNTLNTACSSSANAILLGMRLIQSGRLDRVVVGGVDSLSKFSVNGFNALRILSADKCKPFDENRDGLNLGEGAAYLVLESEALCKDKKVYAEVKGGGNSNDAFHPSSTSDDAFGPVLAMQRALENAGLNASEIDAINTHGTGTPNNDITESKALMNVFENKVAPFISTKCYTGHTLGASAAIEAVYSILAIVNQTHFPALFFSKPIPETGLLPQLKKEQGKLKHVLSNSFGFGGNCTSLIISQIG